MKVNKLFLLLGLGIFTLLGCKKELDLQPTDVFSSANAYQTLAHIQLGVNEAYNRYSAYANDIYVNALLSDESKLGVDNAGQGALTYRWQYGSDATTGGDVTGAWGSYYAMIDHINKVLSFIPTVTATPSEEPRRNILKGQLLALRALAHFSLMEMYSDRYDPSKAGIPVMKEPSLLGTPARNTMGEVMTQIEADLNEASSLSPAVTVTSFSDTVMNKINIAGYQARVALYKKDYQAAISYATTVINSGVKTLATGSSFQGIWTDAVTPNGPEVLFRRRYSTSTGIGALWTTTGNLIYIAPSDKLVQSFTSNDIRLGSYIGGTAGKYYVNKFYTSSRGGRVVDMKAMRIAEMYLIRAEANARLATPNLTAAAADLNTLRTARITGYTAQTFTDGNVLINAIMDERFKELAFEGFRWYDLKRNNLPVQRLASDANAAWQTLPANSPLWLLPIPRSELDANPNIVQNPGY